MKKSNEEIKITTCWTDLKFAIPFGKLCVYGIHLLLRNISLDSKFSLKIVSNNGTFPQSIGGLPSPAITRMLIDKKKTTNKIFNKNCFTVNIK